MRRQLAVRSGLQAATAGSYRLQPTSKGGVSDSDAVRSAGFRTRHSPIHIRQAGWSQSIHVRPSPCMYTPGHLEYRSSRCRIHCCLMRALQVPAMADHHHECACTGAAAVVNHRWVKVQLPANPTMACVESLQLTTSWRQLACRMSCDFCVGLQRSAVGNALCCFAVRS